MFKLIINFFTFWAKIGIKYKNLKSNEEKKDKSISLGVRSIIQTIICGALTILFLWGLYVCVTNFIGIQSNSSNFGLPILSIIGMVACGFGALSAFIQGVIGGLLYMIYQFKLNKRSIRWLALIVWVLIIAAIIVFALLMFTKL